MDTPYQLIRRNAELETELRLVKAELAQAHQGTQYLLTQVSAQKTPARPDDVTTLQLRLDRAIAENARLRASSRLTWTPRTRTRVGAKLGAAVLPSRRPHGTRAQLRVGESDPAFSSNGLNVQRDASADIDLLTFDAREYPSPSPSFPLADTGAGAIGSARSSFQSAEPLTPATTLSPELVQGPPVSVGRHSENIVLGISNGEYKPSATIKRAAERDDVDNDPFRETRAVENADGTTRLVTIARRPPLARPFFRYCEHERLKNAACYTELKIGDQYEWHWHEYAEIHPEHTAEEWREYYEEKVRPAYLAKQGRIAEGVASGAEDSGVGDACEGEAVSREVDDMHADAENVTDGKGIGEETVEKVAAARQDASTNTNENDARLSIEEPARLSDSPGSAIQLRRGGVSGKDGQDEDESDVEEAARQDAAGARSEQLPISEQQGLAASRWAPPAWQQTSPAAPSASIDGPSLLGSAEQLAAARAFSDSATRSGDKTHGRRRVSSRGVFEERTASSVFLRPLATSDESAIEADDEARATNSTGSGSELSTRTNSVSGPDETAAKVKVRGSMHAAQHDHIPTTGTWRPPPRGPRRTNSPALTGLHAHCEHGYIPDWAPCDLDGPGGIRFANGSTDMSLYRTVLISNIPSNTTLAEVLAILHSGEVAEVKFLETSNFKLRNNTLLDANAVMVIFILAEAARRLVHRCRSTAGLFFWSENFEAPMKARVELLDSPTRPLPAYVLQNMYEQGLTRVLWLRDLHLHRTPDCIVAGLLGCAREIGYPIRAEYDAEEKVVLEFKSLREAWVAWCVVGQNYVVFPGVEKGFLGDLCGSPLSRSVGEDAASKAENAGRAKGGDTKETGRDEMAEGVMLEVVGCDS